MVGPRFAGRPTAGLPATDTPAAPFTPAGFPAGAPTRTMRPRHLFAGTRAVMGRIFEVRKHTMFARWNRMAKQFARIAKDITMSVKSGGPDPQSNPTLRRVMQNARAVNMPKDRVEAAIKRASGRDAANYQQVLYEGYAPHGVAMLVETATDNPTRTVASVRSIITKHGGNLATNGSVSFLFNKMGVFRLDPAGIDQDDLELYLIDHGLEEMGEGTGEKGEPQIVIRCAFADFGKLQEALETRKIAPLSAEHEYICTVPTQLPEAQATEVLELIDKLEQDDDVHAVFHTLV
jgi:YebC/PmpR family DNA-binding regulatory protein